MAKGGKRSGGGGGKQRKYTRDNNGRFASTGTGATARGGRLKTAAGNKRATVTAKAAGGTPAGTMKGKVKRDAGAVGKIGQAKAAAPKAAKRKAIGAISEAKAGRIISRIDANRPGLRKATGSARKTQNSIRTQGKATDFALAAGARARKQGKSLSVNESLQRGVKNAAAKSRKSPKAAAPSAPKAAKSSKSKMRTTKRTPLAFDSSIAKRLAMFKSDKQLTDQRTKSLSARLKKETNSVEKIKTSSAISESQLKSKSYNREITRMEARPIMGKRAGGRGNKPVSGPKAKRPNIIKGKPKRDAKVASKVKAEINLNASRYKNIYINSANQKGKAAAKRKPRPMR
jgi:hypothetical protein